MKRVYALLDAARDVCGSDAALARRIGIDPSHPAQWRAGKRKINAEMVGLLADVVGMAPEDAQRLALMAVIEGAKDPGKQGVLRKVFFALSGLSAEPVGPTKPAMPARAPRTTEARVELEQPQLTKRALVRAKPVPKTH